MKNWFRRKSLQCGSVVGIHFQFRPREIVVLEGGGKTETEAVSGLDVPSDWGMAALLSERPYRLDSSNEFELSSFLGLGCGI
jgi:hypothetical protein